MLTARTDKRDAILVAAAAVFLEHGYIGSSMDDVASLAAVSKQTLYKHFESKERLFVQVVFRMTADAGDEVLSTANTLRIEDGLEPYLVAYATRQLRAVVTPVLMKLRRLVIAEVSRFPDLARALYEGGPIRAQTELATLFSDFQRRGLLLPLDPAVAASQFNWLVMAEPLNRSMLLGDAGVPDPDWLDDHAVEAVRCFLAAYAAAA